MTISNKEAVAIAIDWQDSGRGWPLAALATGRWTAPLNSYQIRTLTRAADTIEGEDGEEDQAAFLTWLQGQQRQLRTAPNTKGEDDDMTEDITEATAADQLRGQLAGSVRDPFALGDVIRWTSAGKWTYVAVKTTGGWFTTAGGGEGNYLVPGRCSYEELLEVLQRSDVSNVSSSAGWSPII